MATALRAVGLPVEVVGLGGLLNEPEVADLLALLRVLVDPTAGPAALRLLTGARWQLGMADLAALSDRASSADPARHVTAGSASRSPDGRRSEQALTGLARARTIDACVAGRRDLRSRDRQSAYSAEGFRGWSARSGEN